MNKVSVIMATYNTPKAYLHEAIESILNQTYKNIELIIVCDGSEDEFNYLKNKYSSFNEVVILFNETNKGLPYSLNLGIKKSKGDYIARMDSDDISINNRIECQLDFLRKTGCDLCGSSAYLIGSEKGIKNILFNHSDEIAIQILYRASLIHPTVLAKRVVYETFKYDESYLCSQDFELWGRVAEKFSIGLIDRPLLKYRVHEKQATEIKKNLQIEYSKKIITRNANKFMGYERMASQALWYLSGREAVDRNNYAQFNQLIDNLIDANNKLGIYDKKTFKRVIYNRFFEIVLKSGIVPRELSGLRKVMRIYNICDLIRIAVNRYAYYLR